MLVIDEGEDLEVLQDLFEPVAPHLDQHHVTGAEADVGQPAHDARATAGDREEVHTETPAHAHAARRASDER